MENKNFVPICCVVGHVDSGKTSFLDKLKSTNIQNKEVGGITQQIGTTFFSYEAIEDMTKDLKNFKKKINGLLIIDTPGHDCFTDMRIIAIRISNIPILIIDIIKGLESQTIQCINFLKKINKNFIIILNKIDKIYEWKSINNATLKKSFSKQKKDTLSRLNNYINNIIVQLAINNINACAYYNYNKTMGNINDYVLMVPLSSKTGEGIVDLITLISEIADKIKLDKIYDHDKTCGYFLETKYNEKYGLLNHVILINGNLNKNDNILIQTNKEEIATIKIKEILIPSGEFSDATKLTPVDEIKNISSFVIKTETKNDIFNLGTIFIKNDDLSTEKENKEIIKNHNKELELKYDFDDFGVIINVPCKNMAFALIYLLKNEHPNIKIHGIHVGNINKKIIIKTSFENFKSDKLTMLETIDIIYKKRYSVIFDYNTSYDEKSQYFEDIKDLAHKSNVTIISGNLVHKLVENYNSYVNKLNLEIYKLFPDLTNNFKLQILPKYIFFKKNPILFGVRILDGTIKKNITIKAVLLNNNNKIIKGITIGKIVSIQKNNKAIEEARKGDEVCIKIDSDSDKIEYGVDFDHNWILISSLFSEINKLKKKYCDIFQ